MNFKSFRFLLFCIVSQSALSQSDSFLKRYPPSVYNAGPSIYHILKSQSGILYFATNQGILEYDGASWDIIDIANYSDIKYLTQAEDSTIYVGANNDFGYLQADSTGLLVYHSLAEDAKNLVGNFDEVWQVLQIGDAIYFQSYIGIFKWENGETSVIPIVESYIFNINNRLFATSLETYEFGPVIDGVIQPVGGAKFEDGVFQVFPFDENQWLIATSESGLYMYDELQNSLSEFKCEATEYIKEFAFFDGVKINQNLYVFGTWEGGVMFINHAGEVLKILDKESGLLANMVFHAVKGHGNYIWLGTSDGIAQIDMSLIPELKQNIQDNHELDQVVVREFLAFSENESMHYSYRYPNDSIVNVRFTTNPYKVEVNFASPAMIGEKIEYSSMLEGYETNWSAWEESTRKEYTNLSPGMYQFNIKARNAEGFETAQSSFTFKISYPWYLLIGKYVGIVAIIGLFSFIIIQTRTARLNRTNKLLEKLVAERTQEILAHQIDLEKSNKELLNTNNELDNFVYHTSHDLKAPLKSVLGLVSLSKKENISNQNVEVYLDMIEKSINKLEEFIISIIEYSSNVKTGIEKEEIDFETLIDESIEQHKEFDGLKTLKIIKNINLDGPFYSDSKRLSIIINNIITNAIKYRDRKKENAFLHINIFSKKSELIIEFEDNGNGIDEAYHEKIFEMFTRASENSHGSGLGLYIVKGTLEKLGGTISVESMLNVGTKFTINFPLEQNHTTV